MTTPSAVAPPPETARRPAYTQQLHTLVDDSTRAYTLGLATINAKNGRPKEGEAVRDLLAEAVYARYEADPDEYAKIMAAGRKELRRRARGTQR
jgi:hypothetical protein